MPPWLAVQPADRHGPAPTGVRGAAGARSHDGQAGQHRAVLPAPGSKASADSNHRVRDDPAPTATADGAAGKLCLGRRVGDVGVFVDGLWWDGSEGSVCVCVCVTVSVFVCVCVCERERENVCVCV